MNEVCVCVCVEGRATGTRVCVGGMEVCDRMPVCGMEGMHVLNGQAGWTERDGGVQGQSSGKMGADLVSRSLPRRAPTLPSCCSNTEVTWPLHDNGCVCMCAGERRSVRAHSRACGL
jgi:hypothetical protein